MNEFISLERNVTLVRHVY